MAIMAPRSNREITDAHRRCERAVFGLEETASP
jgi:hypothetical protein